MAILTAIKLLGIVLSGASIIGSERLTKIENSLRKKLQKPEEIVFSEKVQGFFLVYGKYVC